MGRRKPGKREREEANVCHFHEKFGVEARNCTGDCDFMKIREEASAAGAAKHGDRLNLEDRQSHKNNQSYENDPHHENDRASVCVGSYDDKFEDNDGNVFLSNDSEMVVLDEIHEEPEEEEPEEEEVIFQVTNENPATAFLATLSLPKPAPTRKEEEMNAISKMKIEYEEKLKLKLSGVEPAGPAKGSPEVQTLQVSNRANDELKSYESNQFNDNDNSVDQTGNGTPMPSIRRRKLGKRERVQDPVQGANIC